MHARGAPLLPGSITPTGAKVSHSSNEAAAPRSPAEGCRSRPCHAEGILWGGKRQSKVSQGFLKCDLLLLCGWWAVCWPTLSTSWSDDVMVSVFAECKYQIGRNYARRSSIQLGLWEQISYQEWLTTSLSEIQVSRPRNRLLLGSWWTFFRVNVEPLQRFRPGVCCSPSSATTSATTSTTSHRNRTRNFTPRLSFLFPVAAPVRAVMWLAQHWHVVLCCIITTHLRHMTLTVKYRRSTSFAIWRPVTPLSPPRILSPEA